MQSESKSLQVGQGHKRKRSKSKRGNLIFYICCLAFPVAQFLIFYVGINFNSLLLTFQKVDVTTGTTTYTFFDNLKEALLRLFSEGDLVEAAKQSLLAYVVPLVISTPLALLFSYYIYKKMPMSKLFRVMLFMPSIVSAIVMVVIFKYFAESAIPGFVEAITGGKVHIEGLLENSDTRWGVLMFYNIWIGFGVNCLMYVNSMNNIPPEQVEAAHLDGCIGVREFWHIALPNVYPTLVTFLVVGVAGIFTNQFNIFSFYGTEAPHDAMTYGYWLYRETLATANSPARVPVISAMGVWMTLVAAPLTLLVRWLLEKFGPKTD